MATNTSLSPYPQANLVDKNMKPTMDWLRWFEQVRSFINRVLNKYNANKSGIATLVAGTVVIANNLVTATSYIRLTPQNASGTAGHLSIVITPGVGFTITSTSGLDTRTIFYEIVEAF